MLPSAVAPARSDHDMARYQSALLTKPKTQPLLGALDKVAVLPHLPLNKPLAATRHHAHATCQHQQKFSSTHVHIDALAVCSGFSTHPSARAQAYSVSSSLLCPECGMQPSGHSASHPQKDKVLGGAPPPRRHAKSYADASHDPAPRETFANSSQRLPHRLFEILAFPVIVEAALRRNAARVHLWHCKLRVRVQMPKSSAPAPRSPTPPV